MELSTFGFESCNRVRIDLTIGRDLERNGRDVAIHSAGRHNLTERDFRDPAANRKRARVQFQFEKTSDGIRRRTRRRSEEHTSELQSLMRISYAVFCLKKQKHNQQQIKINN